MLGASAGWVYVGDVAGGLEGVAETRVVQGQTLDLSRREVEVLGEGPVGTAELGVACDEAVVGCRRLVCSSSRYGVRAGAEVGDLPGVIGEVAAEGGVAHAESGGQRQDTR